MNYVPNVLDILKNILQGVDIASDISYHQSCQQIMNSYLLPWQKELCINQLTIQHSKQKNFIMTEKFLFDLSNLIDDISNKK